MAENRPVRAVALFFLNIFCYVLVVDFLVFGVAVVGETIVGGEWAVVEAIMFVTGVLLFGYSTVLLWPTSIEDEEETRMDDYQSTGRIQAIADTIAMFPTDADSPKRLPESGKLFLASVMVVLTAFLIERLFVV